VIGAVVLFERRGFANAVRCFAVEPYIFDERSEAAGCASLKCGSGAVCAKFPGIRIDR
jgi:hypothetical protein